MKIRFQSASQKLGRTGLVVGFVFEGAAPDLGAALATAVAAAKATGDLATGVRKFSLFHPGGRGVPARLGFVGMGKRAGKKHGRKADGGSDSDGAIDTERLRRAAAVAQASAEAVGVDDFVLHVNADDHAGVDAFAAGAAIAEGLVLGAYRYEPPRKEKPKARKALRATLRYAGRGTAFGTAFGKGVRHGTVAAEATVFARDLENRPGNIVTPTHLAAAARRLAGPGVRVRVLDRRAMQQRGMNALLGVARGSAEPPRLIVLDHRPARSKRTVCVVGKGLTFDSGGISIKPAAKMDEMRYDMCGGGAVLGLFHAIRHGALAGAGGTRVVGVVPASENMPDAAAQKPGDVVRAFDGTTIEVLNTDAEGRLILADAIAWAIDEFEPDAVVDLATLTGAVITALGHEVAAVMGDDRVCGELIAAGKAADEPLWQLPLWEVHREQCKSKFADIANINGPAHGGGSINGGAFLSHFVGDTPWAHLDIAGTAWGGIAKDYYRNGASGTGVRTLLHWVRSLG